MCVGAVFLMKYLKLSKKAKVVTPIHGLIMVGRKSIDRVILAVWSLACARRTSCLPTVRFRASHRVFPFDVTGNPTRARYPKSAVVQIVRRSLRRDPL